MAPRSRFLNGWSLFSVITVPMSIAVLLRMSSLDMSRARDISSMIQFSVRCSVPWLYLAFAASSLVVVFPGESSRWLMRNRRYIGLCFATGMGWQLTFIVWMLVGHWSYYLENVYLFLDLAVQAPGYLALFLMTATSFRPGRRRLSARQWRILHKTAIYFLWGTVWSTYWYELYYYDDIQRIDYVFYWAGFAALAVRVLAWTQKQWRLASTDTGKGVARWALRAGGLALAVAGVLGLGFGSQWAPEALGFAESLGAAAGLAELVVPFLPVFLVALGAYLVVGSRQSAVPA